jgi:hypothetical protein
MLWDSPAHVALPFLLPSTLLREPFCPPASFLASCNDASRPTTIQYTYQNKDSLLSALPIHFYFHQNYLKTTSSPARDSDSSRHHLPEHVHTAARLPCVCHVNARQRTLRRAAARNDDTRASDQTDYRAVAATARTPFLSSAVTVTRRDTRACAQRSCCLQSTTRRYTTTKRRRHDDTPADPVVCRRPPARPAHRPQKRHKCHQ